MGVAGQAKNRVLSTLRFAAPAAAGRAVGTRRADFTYGAPALTRSFHLSS